MSEENRIRFAGLMEEYLNIPSFVCELIEKQLEDNKYKEVIEYVVQRRNEIENKVGYLSEQEKINQYLNLQQKVEQLEKEIKKLNNIINELEKELREGSFDVYFCSTNTQKTFKSNEMVIKSLILDKLKALKEE